MADDEKPRWMVTRRTVEEVFLMGESLTFINAHTLSVHGQAVEIAADTDDFSKDAILVCAPLMLPLHDRLCGACDECQAPILYSPHAPKTPKRVCLRCAKRMGAFHV